MLKSSNHSHSLQTFVGAFSQKHNNNNNNVNAIKKNRQEQRKAYALYQKNLTNPKSKQLRKKKLINNPSVATKAEALAADEKRTLNQKTSSPANLESQQYLVVPDLLSHYTKQTGEELNLFNRLHTTGGDEIEKIESLEEEMDQNNVSQISPCNNY